MPRWCALQVILCTVAINEQIQGAVEWKKTLRSTGWVITDDASRSGVVGSWFGCVQTCVGTQRCQAVMYDVDTQSCKEYHDLGLFQMVAATPSQLNTTVTFVRLLSGVVHASRGKISSTFEEAQSDCSSLNAVPVTYSEMSGLLIHRFYQCNCGWVGDGKPVNTMQQHDDGTCSSLTPPAIMDCSVQIGAWCHPSISYW